MAFPVFSVDTVEQAEAIQVLFCTKQYTDHPDMPGKSWYVWTNFGGEIEDMNEVTLKMDEFYEAWI